MAKKKAKEPTVTRFDWLDWNLTEAGVTAAVAAKAEAAGIETAGALYELAVSGVQDVLTPRQCTAVKKVFDAMFERHPEWKPDGVANMQAAAASSDGGGNLSSIEVEHYREIVELEPEVRRLEEKWAIAKDKSLAAKKLFDESDKRLRDLIRSGPNPQMRLDDGSGSIK